MTKKYSKKNKTIFWSKKLECNIITNIKNTEDSINKIINNDALNILKKINNNSVDLIVTDPPYNLTKKYDDKKFLAKKNKEYEEWIEKYIKECYRVLKKNGSFYICSDWKTSNSIFNICKKFFYIKNRITWSREKGRASRNNWKNNLEDIFFCTKNNKIYTFNIQKIAKKVIAPYKDSNGNNKDWIEKNEKKIRYTPLSNVLTNITVPYWSMFENTEHSTQKPEKLIAKIILTSSNKGDIVLDPFLGSGTTAVVAKKLERKYIGIEISKKYCDIGKYRLKLAEKNNKIQGYNGKYFEEKNV